MTWPTPAEVDSMTWEETRHWIQNLPGTRTPEQLEIIRALCRKNVSYWPKRTVALIPSVPSASNPELDKPSPAPSPPPAAPSPPLVTKKPKLKPEEPARADLSAFRDLFGR